MTPSPQCKELIKSCEGCRLEAYLDDSPERIPTIGYGDTCGVKPGDTITQPEADRRLELRLQEFARLVNRALTRPVTQNQFDALVSFAYNCANWRTSTLIKLVNQGNMKLAAMEFDKWIHSGQKILPGLVKRRAAERALFERAA